MLSQCVRSRYAMIRGRVRLTELFSFRCYSSLSYIIVKRGSCSQWYLTPNNKSPHLKHYILEEHSSEVWRGTWYSRATAVTGVSPLLILTLCSFRTRPFHMDYTILWNIQDIASELLRARSEFINRGGLLLVVCLHLEISASATFFWMNSINPDEISPT